MNVTAVELWLQENAGLESSTLGAGVVARAARDRIEALKCARVEDYLDVLARSEEERHALVDLVIVPETWFFRDRAAFDALVGHVLETWAPAHPDAVFHVLSVPCSTGEEPYSIAMALLLAGWPAERLRIDAVDISRENIRRARIGVYGRNSFRRDDHAFRDACFEVAEGGAWRIGERARAPVRFEQGNLLAGDFPIGRGPYDAIFCRNLLIYFDRETQRRAIRALTGMLAPGGWMAVGPAEPVLLFEHGYAALRIPSAFLLERAPPAPAAPARKPPPPTPRPATRPPLPKARPAAATPPAAAPDTVETIRALADAGRLDEAARRGVTLLEKGAPTAELLYVLAVVHDARGDLARAEENYRKALYLDPRHAGALSHLALLAEKKGDNRAAQRLRRRVQGLPADHSG